MRVRHRILLAALGLGVVGVLVVFVWSESRKDSRPKLSFTPSVITNGTERFFKARVKNNESCTVILCWWYVGYEGSGALTPAAGFSASTRLAKGESVTISFPVEETFLAKVGGRRWQVLCCADRETSFGRFRRRLASLPLLNRIIKARPQVWIRSELFDQ